MNKGLITKRPTRYPIGRKRIAGTEKGSGGPGAYYIPISKLLLLLTEDSSSEGIWASVPSLHVDRSSV